MATTSHPRAAFGALPIQLDPSIPNQAFRVHSALRNAIIHGLLAPGFRLPSTRDLAEQLAIGRNSVVAAYEHLISDGLIEARHGSGSFVAAGLPSPPTAIPASDIPLQSGRRLPFALGQTHVEPAFLSRLASATRRHIAEASLADLGYGEPRGSVYLREQIARFLAAHRGIRCDPSCIVVLNGTQHGLRLCAEALLTRGDTVWVEDPGYGAARNTLTAAGLSLVPVPVDASGLDVAAGKARAPRARGAYVTPSHQFPTGVAMAMHRRIALIEWAQANDAFIFEDDYDSEFRYSGPPLTALAGLSARRVIYIGTFAKTLFPGLRLGYLVVPPDVLAPILTARAAIDRFSPVFMQNAVADLMADGTIAAHLRRNLRHYRAARDMVAHLIGSASGGTLRPDIPEQGLHMIAWLPEGTSSDIAREIRQAAQIDAVLFSETLLEPHDREGFVLGFAGYSPDALTSAAERLAAAARHLLGA